VRFAFRLLRPGLGIFRDGVQRGWYVALLLGLLALPLLIRVSRRREPGLHLRLCGSRSWSCRLYRLVSLGHAAFLGIGAYTHVYVVHDLGLPWIVGVALACAVTAAAGVLVGCRRCG